MHHICETLLYSNIQTRAYLLQLLEHLVEAGNEPVRACLHRRPDLQQGHIDRMESHTQLATDTLRESE